jgi:undecaprenyl-diphosphatase
MEGASFIDIIQGIDESITLFINSFHSVATDQFWQFCSNKIAWIPIYVFAVLFMVKEIGWKRSLAFLIAIALGFLFCDQLSNLVKDYVHRLRPNYSYDLTQHGLIVLESRGGFFGFFSAHAANAFCTAACYAKAFKYGKYKHTKAISVAAFTWASLVALSRVFVGKHYFGDVLAGALIGLVTGMVLANIAILILRRVETGYFRVGKIDQGQSVA